MGGYVPDINVGGLLEQLNLRFGPKEAITEMAAVQKEFNVFSPEHSLADSFALLNLGPTNNWSHRRGWYRYLKSLNKMPCRIEGSRRSTKNGHDHLISVLAEHLAQKNPAPVHFTSHSTKDKGYITISSKPRRVLPYSTCEFLVVSLPMTPIEKDRAKRRSGKEQ